MDGSLSLEKDARLCLTVAVTGHRDLSADEVPRLRESVHGFLSHLVEEYPDLQIELLSGMAAGADQLVVEQALSLGLPVVAVLPLEVEEYCKDFADGGRVLRSLLEHCEVVTMPRLQGEDPTVDPEARARHYAHLGVFLSNHCQVLLALWDGKPSDHTGGTGGVVSYHLSGVMPGYDLEEAAPNLLANSENDLAFHVVCSRDRDGGAPEASLEPLQAYWLTGAFGRQSSAYMPWDYDLMLDRLGVFSRDLGRYAAALESEARGLLVDAPEGLEWPRGVAYVDRLYAMADWLAVHYQHRFASGLLFGHVLAVLMGVVFIIYSEFIVHWPLAVLFMVLFLTGFVVHAVGERREWHRKYLDYRALAEGLRVQVYWSLAGVVRSRSAGFAYDNFLQKQDVDLAWIRHVMRSASLRRERHHPPDSRWVPWVIARWVGDRDSGQLGYYSGKARSRAAQYRRTRLLSQVALWGGIVMAGVLAVLATRLDEMQAIVLLILMGILPLVAGVRDAYSHKKADKELIKQYRFMADVLGNARRLLDGNDELVFQRKVLKALGSAALEEHAEWLLMHRERPLEPGGL